MSTVPLDPHHVTIGIAPDLEPIVALGVLLVAGAVVLARDPRLDGPLAEAERAVRSRVPADPAPVRTMYKRLGLDPTKIRPSSEALLRRVGRGDPLPRINSLVDICNWCSLELQVPYGLYDAGLVSGDVELRLGRPGEEYPGIRKDVVHLAGRAALVDAEGPFGNPTSDSARTMVTPEKTTSALIVIFAPRALPRARLAAALDLTAARVTEFTGAQEVARFVV